MAVHSSIQRAARFCRMGNAIRERDWTETPLGPIERWPDRLRFALEICLRSSTASAVYWGPELTLLYNDAFADVLGAPEERLLGLPAAEAYARLWDWLGPQFAQVMDTGEGMVVAEQKIPITRNGVIEETYWTYTLNPLVAEDGTVCGIMTQRDDVTRAVLAERRLSFQIRLADALRGEGDPQQVKHISTALLGDFLKAPRVGYAEVDEATGVAVVRSDWSREPGAGLAGSRVELGAFGEEALAYLRSGEVLVLADIRDVPTERPGIVGMWETMGVRALITVPLVREGELKALLYVHEPQPRHWRRAEAAIARDVAERTWSAVERARAERSLRDSEDHYRRTVQFNPQVTWTALADGSLNRVADRWAEWTGTTGLGDSWTEGLHPDDIAPTGDAWRRSVASGADFDVEHRLMMRDGSIRWARSRAFPQRGSDGAIELWYGSTEDIHERKVAEEHQRLLINELNHRVKNSLASVQAIAFQTLKGDISVAEARSRFESRLLALSRAHTLLTEQNWERADLEHVVRDATEHLSEDGGRFLLSGEPLWVTPRAALALALAMHELGTNAAKYGALSKDGGTISISWRLDERNLLLDWKERGGPPVTPPLRRGFGSRLIEKGLGSDLNGRADLTFEPDGVRCSIQATLETVRAVELG
ncbi:HWE histidine kinase domain-containing protein [Sphingosinicella sp. BN140058]|uniref:sensor histidine kinase n=1 Tax=Sphingosinicella sp. BN140058 TaxID=1892855 RepID=UPI001012D6AE|nr:HWE histidine kinase domain-containing protein [Sphingosinicella sp. BN140058]QAY77200.1 PAS domain S-box protein [Sphingosinicella sp. BN140058]